MGTNKRDRRLSPAGSAWTTGVLLGAARSAPNDAPTALQSQPVKQLVPARGLSGTPLPRSCRSWSPAERSADALAGHWLDWIALTASSTTPAVGELGSRAGAVDVGSIEPVSKSRAAAFEADWWAREATTLKFDDILMPPCWLWK